MRQPNARSCHVLTDEITWEQCILKKCPCRQVERRFSETQCSQVGVFEATWEQYVPENRPSRPLQGRFFKTYRSQVFRRRGQSCYQAIVAQPGMSIILKNILQSTCANKLPLAAIQDNRFRRLLTYDIPRSNHYLLPKSATTIVNRLQPLPFF